VVVAVEPAGDMIERGDKCRAASLRLLRIANEDEIADAIRRFSAVFSPHADRMAEEQIAWRAALARPKRNVEAVECGLRAALEARKLIWELKRFDSAGAARDAWDAWDAGAAWDARAAWAAWDARAAWDAGAAGAARDARDAWAAWDAWDAWAAGDARAAWDARAALMVCFASVQGWVVTPADALSVGLRDAYEAGLDLALPIAPNTLGWAMAVPKA
jgi:hypothetical protein